MPESYGASNLQPQLWGKEVIVQAMDKLFFTKKNMIGEGENNIVQLKNDLKANKGSKITFGFVAKLTGHGVQGDNEMEGNEERMLDYDEDVEIDQIRQAIRLKGTLNEKKTAYNLRSAAKRVLSTWLKEFWELQIFLKLGGVTNTTLTDVPGRVVGTRAAWSNTPDYIPDADTAAGTGNRYLCAQTSGAASLSTSDKLTPDLISLAKLQAMMADPVIEPLIIDGEEWYVMFVHPHQAFDLKQNAVYAQAAREAQARGKDNPLFTGALMAWDKVILHEHKYVPCLDITVAGNSFRGAASGTNFSADAYRALLCGQNAASMAVCNHPNAWVENTKDYKNQVGFCVAAMGGVQKNMFNSKEHGVIALDTSSSRAV
jgi:N4-gp56 family major capsid protein